MAILSTARGSDTGKHVHPLRFVGDDRELAAALRAEHPGAPAALYDRYADHVERVLVRILGFDQEQRDLLQEVFLRAITGARSLRDDSRLKAWLTSIAVFTARDCIRRRTRWRFVQVRDPVAMPDPGEQALDDEGRETLRAVYGILTEMPTDERIAFTLRFIEGLELKDVADACRVSLSTIKRRLGRAEKRFLALAKRQPAVRERIARGERW